MSLLEIIKRAAAGGEVPAAAAPSVTKFPVVLDPQAVLLKLTPEEDAPSGAFPLTRLVGWQIPEAGVKASEKVQKLVKTLRRKLKNPKTLGRQDFLRLLNSFPTENLGNVTDGDLVALLVESCMVLDIWEPLEDLVCRGLVGRVGGPSDIVEKLVEKGRSDLLCIYAKQATDLRASELLLILRHFLSPTKISRESLRRVRKEWESQCLFAMEKAIQKGLQENVATLAREASILLMMAYDGFSSSELCLHYLFSSPSLDGFVMASALSKLGVSEVLRLIKYLRKWLEKYERFPEACPCSEAGPTLGLKACDLVPSLELISGGLGLLIDEHYSSLVLNPKFHEEMKSLWSVVESSVSVSGSCCSLAEVIGKLRGI